MNLTLDYDCQPKFKLNFILLKDIIDKRCKRLSDGGGRMAADMGEIGPSVVENNTWGTHGCLFYDTKKDLLDTLVEFFKSGLKNGDSCLWIVSEPLNEEECMDALRQSVSDFDQHRRDQTIELVPYKSWFFDGGTFDSQRAVRRLQNKLDQALARGSAALRATADSSWVEQRRGEKLLRNEADLDESIQGRPVALLCTCTLSQNRAAEKLGAIHIPQAAASIRHGVWKVIETPQSRLGKEQVKALSHRLEQEVVNLRVSNEKLKKEIKERKRVEDELQKQEEVL